MTLMNSAGSPQPFGATIIDHTINFSLYAETAISVTLCLFTYDEASHRALPLDQIKLDPVVNKTGSVWHILVTPPSLEILYAYRIDDLSPLILDPYAKEVVTGNEWGKSHSLIESSSSYAPLGAVYSQTNFDWEGDRKPHTPMKDLILYEMHVRGFTQHPSSGVKNPGTFLGIIEKIPHLLELGVNAIELLPIYEFNELEYAQCYLPTSKTLYNYWGYSTVNFFAPMNRYASLNKPGSAKREFQLLVKELHKHGIEVILDVVYNHTAEGNEYGPVLSFKGLADCVFYMKNPKNEYLNYSGCGNTFNCNHPVVRRFICDSLCYWVTEMHVDGFRFDLASIFSRDTHGKPVAHPPLLDSISKDPILSQTKLIVEPWDAAGLFQVGSFPGDERWVEWNGRYRDTIRRYIKGNEGVKGEFATRLSGSEDLYNRHHKRPFNSMNFVTCHDGFSLMDLVSYNQKHNLENGENNRDGFDYNDSWNCGEEGPTTKKAIQDLRERQIRNFHLALMISQGIPMLWMGEEYGHSKNGNNNAWCQDQRWNWFSWDQLNERTSFYRFYRLLIQFRKQHSILRRDQFLIPKDIDWHGFLPLTPCWDITNHFIAFTLRDFENEEDLYVAFNAGPDKAVVTLPNAPSSKRWHEIVNTQLSAPHDFKEQPQPLVGNQIQLLPYSSVLFKAK